MRQALPGLAGVSSERLRDELFRILDGPAPASAIRILDILGAVPYVLPELPALKGVAQSPPHIFDVWDHTLATLHELGNLLDVLKWEYDPETAASWALGLVSLRLGRFRAQLRDHLELQLNPERSNSSLINLAALFHDISKPQSCQNRPGWEHSFLQSRPDGREDQSKTWPGFAFEQPRNRSAGEYRPLSYASDQFWRIRKQLPSRRAIYRFFRAAGDFRS